MEREGTRVQTLAHTHTPICLSLLANDIRYILSLLPIKNMHRSRNICRGGGGGRGGVGSMPDDRKQPGQRFFFFFYSSTYFTVYRGVQWFYYRENYTFPRLQRGSNIFHGGGVQLFQGRGGGPNANFYRNPFNL